MKTSLWAVLVLVSACGVVESEVAATPDELDTQGEELSTTKDTFLLARRDVRRCISPLCGGYWVKDLNSTMMERYVSAFDFSQSLSLPVEEQDKVTGAPDNEVVIFGRLGPKETRFNTRTLLVKDAYRALPGNTVPSTDKFYGVGVTKIACVTTPCANLQFTRLNRTTGHVLGTEVSIENALRTRVQGDWVMERIRTGRAVVAGHVERSGGNVVLSASQVYVQLRDQIQSCPRFALPNCSNGKIVAWTRTANRCTVPVGCTAPGVCAQFFPTCEAGYTLVSWMNLCPRYACEPEWAQ